MIRRLVRLYWEDTWYYVDFRLEEIRNENTTESTPFTDIHDEDLRARIRGVRAVRSLVHQMKGLDDYPW